MKPTADDVPELRSALLDHYDLSARDLPWRRDRHPYRVLVSEVMLQQTRVDTVLRYYEPWLERFPTTAALADADEDEVLKAWEGLGYYGRARRLHRAAKLVRERAGGEAGDRRAGRGPAPVGEVGSPGDSAPDDDAPAGFPTTSAALRELPGVGEYTAGAVASIAFQEVVPAVDGNVRRVLARLFDEPDPKPAWLRERAGRLVDPDRPGDWNQALMELGATVCTPRSPGCDGCPVEPWCGARAAGTVEDRPAPKEKKPVPHADLALAVLERDGRLLLERRPGDGLLGGLWAFPEIRLDERAASEVSGSSGEVSGTGRIRALARDLGLRPRGGTGRPLAPVRHRFSHLDATYHPVVVEVDGQVRGEWPRPTRWIAPGGTDSAIDGEGAASVALPVAQRKVLDAWRDAVRARTHDDPEVA